MQRAEQHIENLALAPRDEYELLRVTRLNVAVADRQGGVVEQRVIDVGVAFRRVVDNIRVVGPGGKIIVYMDHEGELTGFDRIWREIEDVHQADVELRSPESAAQEAQQSWGQQVGGQLVVDDIRFGYFERDWAEEQAYLQPAYFLPLTITAASGVFEGQPVMRSEHFTAAAVNPPEVLLHPQPLPPEEQQAPRYEVEQG